MNRKKILATSLVAVMSLTAVSGCASSTNSTSSAASENGTSDAKEDYVIQYLIPGAKDSISLNNDIGKEIYDKFGIKLDIVGYAGDWEEKCATMLAGNDYPDMVQLQGQQMVKKYINAGALLDVEKLAEQYAPNFLDFYKDSIPYWKLISDDGKDYIWTASTPDVERATTAQFDMIIRSDILEQQGWPEVLDEDSYISLLKKGLQDNPETDGSETLGLVSGASEEWVLGCLMTMYSKGRYSESSGIVTWDTQDNKFVDSVLDTTYWKSGVKFWNKLYREGILDTECFTDTDSVAAQKLSSGRALSTFYVTWEMGDINNTLKKSGKENMEYVTMPIMLNDQLEAGDKRVVPIIDSYTYQSVGITKNAKDPERIMELLNWVCTDEGQVLLGWGVEGKHYTVGSDGKRAVTQDYLDCRNGVSSDTAFNDGVGSYYFLGLSAGFDPNEQVYNVSYDESVSNVAMDDRTKEIYSHYGWSTVTDPWKNNSKIGYDMVHSGLFDSVSLESGSDAEAAETKLKEYKYKQIVPLIMASSDEEFESLWTDFVNGYKELKPEFVLKGYTDSYNNIKAKFDKLS